MPRNNKDPDPRRPKIMPPARITVPDWSKADDATVREAYRLAEERLTAQVQIAVSADSRATVLAGLFAAAATGVVGAIASAWETLHKAENMGLLHGSYATAGIFLVGAALCALSSFPIRFHVPGILPANWYPDIASNRSLILTIGDQLDEYDTGLFDNDRTLARNACIFRVGAFMGILAPLFGLLIAIYF